MAWHRKIAEERFAKIDTNGDGVINKEDRPERPEGAGEGRKPRRAQEDQGDGGE